MTGQASCKRTVAKATQTTAGEWEAWSSRFRGRALFGRGRGQHAVLRDCSLNFDTLPCRMGMCTRPQRKIWRGCCSNATCQANARLVSCTIQIMELIGAYAVHASRIVIRNETEPARLPSVGIAHDDAVGDLAKCFCECTGRDEDDCRETQS
eukprot:scaffold201756_cov31-Tisochrysis_lutea.AAC.1